MASVGDVKRLRELLPAGSLQPGGRKRAARRTPERPSLPMAPGCPRIDDLLGALQAAEADWTRPGQSVRRRTAVARRWAHVVVAAWPRLHPSAWLGGGGGEDAREAVRWASERLPESARLWLERAGWPLLWHPGVDAAWHVSHAFADLGMPAWRPSQVRSAARAAGIDPDS